MRIPPGVRRMFRLPPTSERIARELDDEVRFHVEMRVKKLIDHGYAHDAAYAEALRQFGDVDDLRDYCVNLEVATMERMQTRERMDTLIQDLRFALRQYRKAPGFAFIAALTLALGVGATTAIFSVVNGVIIRPLPFHNSEQIVRITGIDAKGARLGQMADPTFDALAAQARSLSAIAEYHAQTVTLVRDGEAVRVPAAYVSRGFFDVLGVKPIAGRLFLPEELQLNAPPAAIISNGMWQRQFAGSASAIGARLQLGASTATVVAVLPPGQEFPAGADIYIPRELESKNTSYTAHNWLVIGRIRNGVSLIQANHDVSDVLRRLRGSVGEATWTVDGKAVRLREQLVGNIKPLLVLLFAASAVLLMIACANVANLLVARMASREGEIAVRLALGADRRRLAQQLLIEAGVLAGIGCVMGLALAYAGVRVLLALRPALIPRVGELSVDWTVLGFALVVSAATALALGLIAAWRGVRGDLRAALAQSQRTQGGGGASYRLRGSLVVVQLAMTVVLLVGAGLLTRSFIQLLTIDAGFRMNGVVDATLSTDFGDGDVGFEARQRYYEDILAKARAVPGVTVAGLADSPPFSGGSSNGTFLVMPSADQKFDPSQFEVLFQDKTRTGYANYAAVDANYFKALGIPLVIGRLFDGRDRRESPHVAVINSTLAKTKWPAGDALGKVIEFGNIDQDLTPMTIVGIVGDTREQDLSTPASAEIYVSVHQRPSSRGVNVVMATSNETATIAGARQAFRQVRGDVPSRFRTIEEIIGQTLATQRFMLLLVGVFATVALSLATLGVYSVISYLVAQRGREISIRVALGARSADIVWLVIGQGLQLTAIGAGVGIAASLVATRALKTLLYQISATDPIAFASVIVVLGVVASVASYLPARRASKAEPMDVLRAS